MTITDKESLQNRPPPITPAEPFDILFRSLPKQEKMAVAKFILEDEEVQKNAAENHIPNELTLRSFEEDKSKMPRFDSLEALRKDFMS